MRRSQVEGRRALCQFVFTLKVLGTFDTVLFAVLCGYCYKLAFNLSLTAYFSWLASLTNYFPPICNVNVTSLSR